FLGVLLGGLEVACSTGGADPHSVDDQTDIPVLQFTKTFQTSQSGALKAPGKVRIHYDPERLRECRANLNDGSPGWTITGYGILNGGTARSFYVAGHNPSPGVDPLHPPDAIVDLAEQGDLALFFQVTDLYGCSAYDSSFGQNFHFSVAGSTH